MIYVMVFYGMHVIHQYLSNAMSDLNSICCVNFVLIFVFPCDLIHFLMFAKHVFISNSVFACLLLSVGHSLGFS